MAKGADRTKAIDYDLEKLAEYLIARHLRNSLPDGTVRDRLAEVHHESVYPSEMVERGLRCIAVVGASASLPLAQRGDDLADELEKKFKRDERELDRVTRVSGGRRDEFETRLIALSTGFQVQKEVRSTISRRYNMRAPTLLVYELLAHLLKHRFLDGIISFNFDELLDQSLEDELGPDEFRRLLSDRDCTSVQGDPDAPDYVPLYIKLHGTASEPESLRFTREAYYSLPDGLVDVAREMLHAEECVIVNVGFGLGSFDFQRLLAVPSSLRIFNLSPRPLEPDVVQAIETERQPQNKPTIEPPEEEDEEEKKWLFDCSADDKSCRDLVETLSKRIAGKTQPPADAPEGSSPELVDFRSVIRHEAIAQILGPESINSTWASTPEWSERELAEYLRRRTILELALAGAKARGLVSLVPLSEDRPARYYDRYRRAAGKLAERWESLCSAAGLVESDAVPDILLSESTLRKQVEDGTSGAGGRMDPLEETRRLHEFDPQLLAHHVLRKVKNPLIDEDIKLLKQAIEVLQSKSDVEIHTQDDHVCSKAFRRPAILTTATSLQAYTSLMLRGLEPRDEIYISSETGHWLLTDSVVEALKQTRTIRVLLAFDIDKKDLKEKYGRRVKPLVIEPWRHNRHMTIVCQGNRPVKAIYFARRLRTPVITPVFLDGPRDVQRLMTMYMARWDEAERDGGRGAGRKRPRRTT